MYYYGEGVEKDYSKAFKLYIEYIETSPEFKLLNSIFGNRKTENNQELKKAVEDNDLKEQISIGKYFFDKQRTQDYKKALEWYMKAAEQGYEKAQYMVRQIYFKIQDYDNLLKWCKKGIEQNQTDAKYTMGLIFLKGYGVEKNILKAKEWYEKAAEDNDASTQYQLGRLYFDKNELQNDYKKAFYWTEKAEENKYQPAIDFLPIIKSYTIPVMAAAKDNDFEFVKESIEIPIDSSLSSAIFKSISRGRVYNLCSNFPLFFTINSMPRAWFAKLISITLAGCPSAAARLTNLP